MRQRTINSKTKMAAAVERVATSAKRKKATDLLAAHLRDPKNVPEPRLPEIGLFTEEDIRAIQMVAFKQAQQAFDEAFFFEQMVATTPVMAKPRIDVDPLLDFWRTIALPEICEELWPAWNSKTGRRGPDPGYMAKAILLMTATLGKSAHFDDNYTSLAGLGGVGYRAVFEWLEQTGAAATGRKPRELGMKTYSKLCEQIGLVTDPIGNPGALTTDRCHTINRELWRWLQKQFPGFGKRVGLDTMMAKAWIQQFGCSEADWERIALKAPNASERTISGRDGTPKRHANGYYLAVLSDLATGVPLVWRLLPAGDGYHDHHALLMLLDDLFAIDPEFPTEVIVADKAWNSADCVRDCAVRYGIHMISGLDTTTEQRKVRKLPDHSGVFGGYDGMGNVYCKQHGTVMQRSTTEFFGREKRAKAGLKPGEEAPQIDSNFRHRLKCEHGGGPCEQKPTLPMSVDWNGFSYYPHTIDGGRKRDQAFRLAMYARRNTCEAIFGALKLGQKLGLESADRTHTPNENTIETLLSLGLLMRTAVVTANERIKAGEMPEDPPPDLADRLQ